MSDSGFPATADAFYALRDNRINVYGDVDARYTQTRVHVTADPAIVVTPTGRTMLGVSANLLSRWCRTVSFDVPADGMDEILAKMRDADPFGRFNLVEGDPRADLRLHIGANFSGNPQGATVISAQGWYAAVRRAGAGHLDSCDGSVVVGAAAAAVLGGAQLFRDAVDAADLYSPDFLFDAFLGAPAVTLVERDFDRAWQPPPTLDLLMLGAGSVGSASAYFLTQLNILANVDISDADIVKVENFSRSPLFGKSTYLAFKPSAVASSLAGTTIAVTPINTWWDEHTGANVGKYDIVLPLANERGIRWNVQSSVPPLMIHASTGGSWNVNFGRHIPGRDDCLADRFSAFMDAERAPMACAQGEVEVAPAVKIDASLPFLSFWAGFLVAADVARVEIMDYPHTPNFAEYSFRGKRFRPLRYDKGPGYGCLCRGQAHPFWTIRGNGRFSGLSPKTW